MSFDSFNKSRGGTGLLASSVPKRENFWNVIQPGDPYDIRKSMIARLPGQNKTNMGEHLEIVCLLQAAEIERLIDNLDDYKLRFKEIEKRVLDRHSYQIQIKELTQKAFDSDRFKKESDKWREFSQKQALEIEEYKKKVSEVDSNVQVKYHKALKQIENMHKDNSDLKNDLNQAMTDLNAWKAKLDALDRTKNREIDEIKNSFQSSKRLEIEKELREVQSRSQNERGIFEMEMKRAKEAIDGKNKEIEDLRVNISQFSRKMQDYSKVAERYEDLEGKIGMATEEIERLNRVLKDRNAELRESQNRLPEYENKVAMLSQEIERLNLVIEKKNGELRNINTAYAENEENLRVSNGQINKFKSELNQFRNRLGNVGEESESYKLRVQKLLGENSNLGEEIRNAQENLRLSAGQLGKLQNEFKSVCIENDDLKKRVGELENTLKRLGSDSNSKLATLSQECERLNSVIEKKNGEIRALGGEIQEHQENLRLSTLQINKYRSEANQVRNQLGSTSEESESYKLRIQKLLGENSNLGEEVRSAQENLRLSAGQLGKIQNQFKSVCVENDDLRKKLAEFEGGYKRLSAESENKVKILTQECERLNSVVEKKNGEIRALGGEIHEHQENLRLSAAQMQRIGAELNDYKNRIGSTTQESETYKQRIQKLLGENNSLNEEFRTAQENLRLSAGQLGKLQNEFRLVCNQNEEYKKKLTEYQASFKKFGFESESKIALLSQECERLNSVVEKKNGEIRALGGQIQEHQENLRLSTVQITKFRTEINEIRGKLGSTSEESESYKQRIQKLLGENNSLGEEMRSAQENLRLSASQLGKLQNEFKNVCVENDELRKRLGEYDNGIKRLSAQSENKVKILTQECERLNSVVEKKNGEIRALGGEVQEYQENLRLSTVQTQRLGAELNDYKNKLGTTTQESQTYKQRIQKILSENNSLVEEVRTVQENLRLSSAQAQRLGTELNEYKNKLGTTSQQSETYKQRIQKLLGENNSLGEEMRSAQENLRLSASQLGKLQNEFKAVCTEYDELKKKNTEYETAIKRLMAESENKVKILTQECERLNSVVEKKNGEIRALGGEVQEYQENLRLSAAQTQRMGAEINEFKSRLGSTTQESEAYKLRIQKLLGENNSLGEEMRSAQENLRLSAGQLTKIQNQFKLLFAENDELKRRLSQSENVSKRQAGESENKIKILMQQCERFNAVVEKKNGEIRALGGEVQEYQENLRLSAAQAQRMGTELNEFKNRLGATSQESESYKQRIQKLLGENTSLGDEVRTAQENLRLSAGTLGKLQNQFKSVCIENDELKKRLNEYENGIKRVTAESENKVKILTQECERLNAVVEKKNGEIRALGGEVQEYQQNLRLSAAQTQRMGAELNEFKNRLGANSQENETYKQRIQKLLGENTSLNEEMRGVQENLRLSAGTLSKLQNQFKIVCDESDAMKRKIQELENGNKKLRAEAENKIAMLSQECERLNVVIEKKNSEIRSLGGEVQEHQEGLRLSSAQLSKIGAELNDLRNRLGATTQESETYKQRIQKLLGENSSLADEMRGAQENLRLSAGTLSKLQAEFKAVCDQSDVMKRKIQEFDNANKKLRAQAETKIGMLSQECERLNGVVEKKNSEIRSLGGEVQEHQEGLRLSSAQLSKLGAEMNDLRNRLGATTQESETYKTRIQKLLGENNSLNQEMRGAQENLRLSAGTLSKLQNQFKSVCDQSDVMKRKLQEFDNANKKLRAEAENKIAMLSQECERLNGVVEKKNSEIRSLGGEVQEHQEGLRLSSAQLSKIGAEMNDLRNRLGATTQESETYKTRIQKLLGENNSLNQEMRGAQENLRLSAGTLSKLQNQFKIVCGENDELKRRVNDYDVAVRRMNGEAENKIRILTQECERLNALVEKRNSEVLALGGEIQEHQDSLRLSSAQLSKMGAEMNDLKGRIGSTSQESEAYKQRIQKLLGENNSLNEEMRDVQENLRLSTGQIGRLTAEYKAMVTQIEEFKKRIAELQGQNKRVGSESENKVTLLSQEIERLNSVLQKKNVEIGNLHQKLNEIVEMTKTMGSLQEKISRLVNQNTSLDGEIRNAQQNLRLSANQNAKIIAQLNEYKQRIASNDQESNLLKQKMNNILKENANLGDQVRNAQENLRLSAGQMSKLNAQLNEYKNRISANNAENDTYKQRVQKLLSENTNLNDEVRNAQENLRLSAGQMGKLQNEFKLVCGENEELKRRLLESDNVSKRLKSEGDNKVAILTQECERLNALVEKRNGEIRALGGEVQEHQQGLRLSAAQLSKMNTELNEFKSRLGNTSQESESYKQRIQKLLSENTNLNEEVRNAQQNLRLSAGQIGKLQNEFKLVCDQGDAMRRKIQELDNANKKLRAEAESKIGMLTQECERLNGAVEKKNIEIRSLGGQVQEHQEGLRLSSAQLSKISAEMNDLKSRLGATTQESQTYKQRIQKLLGENTSLTEEMRGAQENLRLSAGTLSKLQNQFKSVCDQSDVMKRKLQEFDNANKKLRAEAQSKIGMLSQECERLNGVVEKKNSEIRSLGGEVQEHQEGLRLSSAQLSKIGAEMNDLRNRLGATTQESETYKTRIQKLLGENNSLNEEMRGAQENLRLSAGTLSKLQNQFKLACDQGDAMKRKIQELDNGNKKLRAEAENKIGMLTQECERLNIVVEKKNSEIRALGGEVQEHQEGLRLSSAQLSRLGTEMNDLKNRLGATAQESQTYKVRIQKLIGENNSLNEEMRGVQENLRLSTGQIGRLTAEYKAMVTQTEEFKKRIADLENQNKRVNAEGDNKVGILTQECERLNSLVEKRNAEIRALGGEVQEHQEGLRLSAAQLSKMGSEINDYKNRLGATTQESETYKQRIQKLLAENNSLNEQTRGAQQALRLSAGQMGKLQNEFKLVCNQNEELKRNLQQFGSKKVGEYENRVVILSQEIERLNGVLEKKNIELGNLNKKLSEIDAMNKTIGTLQEKITRLVTENTGMDGQMRNAQENLRLSANQNAKMIAELNEYKNRIASNDQESNILKQKINNLLKENTHLDEEVRNAQENLRLSAGQMSKLNSELNEYKSRIAANNSENDTYKLRIQKLISENTNLNDEVRNAQENLRLSAGQMGKLQNEFKLVCGENEELKRRLLQSESGGKRLKSEVDNKVTILTQECERLNALVEKRNGEIRALGGEVQEHQQGLRLSAAQLSKMNTELNEYRNRLGNTSQESESYKQRLQKLLSENTNLNEEVRNAQQNLRLSAGQIGKLQNEFKLVCVENDDLKRRVTELQTFTKRFKTEGDSKVTILTQECQRLNSLVEKKNSEIRSLGGEVQQHQEGLRLSSAQLTKIGSEVNELKSRLGSTVQQTETYRQRIQKLLSENSNLNDQVRNAQENLRLSAGQIGKLQNEFKGVCAENEDLKKRLQDLLGSNKKLSDYESKVALLSQEIERLTEQLTKKTSETNNLKNRLTEIDSMNKTIGSLQEKITRLVSENTEISGDMRNAQENLRLSANQNAKIVSELNEYKQRIDQNTQENNNLKQKINKLISENTSLGDEARTAQESLRLSSANQTKLNAELNQYREQIATNNKESETYRLKMQKLIQENSALGDEVRGVQENLRLSAGTIGKLTNELKITCNENEELKRRLQDAGSVNKRIPEYESKINALSQEIERLNTVIDKKNGEIKVLREGEAEAETLARQVKTLNDQVRRISGEKEGIFNELREGQEQLRLSSTQITKLRGQNEEFRNSLEDIKRRGQEGKISDYEAKIALFSQEIERLNSVIEKKNTEMGSLTRRLQEIDEMNRSIGSLQEKIKKLVNENYSIEEEMRNAQENLRLSANQNAKMIRDINEYKQKIDQNSQENEALKQKINKLVSENSSLGDEARNAQESLRLSSATQAKLQRELNEYKSKITDNNAESETYRIKIQKLMQENNALGDQVRGAQENLRLSAGTIGKLTNELKITCNENEELKKKLQEALRYKVKCLDYEEKIILLSAEIQRLRNNSNSAESENQGSKKKLMQYEAKFGKISSEFEKLNSIIQELRKENQAIKQANYELEVKSKSSNFTEDKIKVLNDEIDRLTVLVEEKEEDLGEIKLRFTDEAALVKRIQEHLALFVVLFAEIESLRKRVKDKEREVEDVRRSSLAPFRN